MIEAKRDDHFRSAHGKMIDGWLRGMWELTRQETCWGACKASQRLRQLCGFVRRASLKRETRSTKRRLVGAGGSLRLIDALKRI